MFSDFLLQKLEDQEVIKDTCSTEDKQMKPYTHIHLPYDEELLKTPLSSANYRNKFHQLLCREEEEHERILNER